MDRYIIASGGFDPAHIGHVEYLRAAREYGCKLIILLNSDEWLMRKKNYVFMQFDERKKILEEMRSVNRVDAVDDADGTVTKGIFKIYNEFRTIPGELFFAKGGDRLIHNTPEVEICHDLGIGMIWNCGGGKVQSSSELVKEAAKNVEG